MCKKKDTIHFKIYIGCFLIILFTTTGFSAFSQKASQDSTVINKPEVVHSPHKATVYSAILPGLGQIYNRKYWKVPIVWGGFVTLGYFINFNNEVYLTYKRAYSDIIDADPFTHSYMELNINPAFFQPDKLAQLTENLRLAKDQWRRNRDLVVISTAIFYAANIIDASVDANFFNFDTSDDLTINWAPGPIMCMDKTIIGIQFRVTF